MVMSQIQMQENNKKSGIQEQVVTHTYDSENNAFNVALMAHDYTLLTRYYNHPVRCCFKYRNNIFDKILKEVKSNVELRDIFHHVFDSVVGNDGDGFLTLYKKHTVEVAEFVKIFRVQIGLVKKTEKEETKTTECVQYDSVQ